MPKESTTFSTQLSICSILISRGGKNWRSGLQQCHPQDGSSTFCGNIDLNETKGIYITEEGPFVSHLGCNSIEDSEIADIM